MYQQIIEQLALAIAGTVLSPGDTLPSVRELAADLRINPNTSARALREMSRLGMARVVRGSGCEVADAAPTVARRIALRILTREIERVVAVAADVGLEPRALLSAVESEWKEQADARGR